MTDKDAAAFIEFSTLLRAGHIKPQVRQSDRGRTQPRFLYTNKPRDVFYVRNVGCADSDNVGRATGQLKKEYDCYQHAALGGFSVPKHEDFTHVTALGDLLFDVGRNYKIDHVIVLARASGIELSAASEYPPLRRDRPSLMISAACEAIAAAAYFNDPDRFNARNMFVTDPFAEKYDFTHIDFEDSDKYRVDETICEGLEKGIPYMLGADVTLDRRAVFNRLEIVAETIDAVTMPSAVFEERIQVAMAIVKSTPCLAGPSL